MAKKILVVHGHPDSSPERYCHALSDAYVRGALRAEHEVRLVKVGDFGLPYVRNQTEWEAPTRYMEVVGAQTMVAQADHIVIVYPLWLGDMPSKLKSFFEHVSCGGSLIELTGSGAWQSKLKGKSARVIVTMGMPAIAYRWYYFAHSLKSLERNILRFSGASPVKSTIIGSVASGEAWRKKWLQQVERLGVNAA